MAATTCIACNGSGHYDHDGAPACAACNGTGFENPSVPLGFTATEVESRTAFDVVDTLIELLETYRGDCDDFMLDSHVFEVVAETLTDGSVKRSIRIRPAEPV